jgi:uncharacterized protein (TIGR02145 family)
MKKTFYLLTIAALLMIVLTNCNKDVAVAGVKLEENSLTLAVGKTTTLFAAVLPENATNKLVTWVSSDMTVATVTSSGQVTAHTIGETTIIVTTIDGNYTVECTVTVNFEAPEEKGVIINGVKWATRNLASHGKFVENPEDYGALFQWGRKGDGHERRTSLNYPTNDNSNENGVVSGSGLDAKGQIVSTHAAYGKFIKQEDYPHDWCVPQKDVLWNSGSATTPIKTSNDPCPVGWRMPTFMELESLYDSGSEWNELNGISGRYFGDGESKLFLPAAGARSSDSGEVRGTGTDGYYWSSTNNIYSGSYPHLLHFGNGHHMHMGSSYRAGSFSVRCVAEH